MLETIVGLFASACTTFAAAPQVIKAWRTRRCEGLSLKMVAFQLIGVATWVLYGVLKGDPIIIVANGLSTLLLATLLYFRITLGHAEPAPAETRDAGGRGREPAADPALIPPAPTG